MEPVSSLQSICYKRGSLQLLDQRKLPLETIYLDIQDAADGWSAIRDMVVRGAPAIAIAAALSLAVEVFNLKAFNGTSDDAASFINKKLEYLVSSRPTAVNLSDAATKLKEVTSKAAATASEAQSIFQAYIEAAEIMLKDDVSSNKAIGSYGASFLQHQLKNSKRLSILTHCNTGSLATAGYGTALGVIRAVHTEGLLERAYCTETRPFNQGSRLTAFELVHDNIPATLIADSAAAALMKDGRVDAVIVGADRVAANGDTANKIGTYSLALCAMNHKIPFYVAAPLTSIDLSLTSGKEIVIEERSPKELTHSGGGLGEQVAASGISVWNPAFDVTPANLIAGIITEKGVITKMSSDAFDIKDFVQKVDQ
ncbi:methylthioribose-1-phosphate isomerase [Alnus glutinosa]|uniref:methylthioribose-1-phosphate isomerase n=1 Tax=Alnus glutinosa TaxID=3517 RepID=UPI002D78BA9D|nr:methylthioribose-1-phosphate isomerase [Alnus glutinosa]XP_062148153.1 methylthioribose-1-phosphate isomerase [Alnus glutinosa]XP_062148154.1 methylthioribose-1-phosphate isomerase [Alnus glutinosa]